ncbi:hypothetical protein EC957_006239 [Mortierella hygrophila]|uniref:Uncharacterized protein n=1 Tax=Mortierella hygrophila TaxID=979708 RepID=A0A9P6EZP0_9FUNG|nr:hypothetical protein EC957_006239 [Mortierella hygrophila]
MSRTTERHPDGRRRRLWTVLMATFILIQVFLLFFHNPISAIQSAFSYLTPSPLPTSSYSTSTGPAGAGHHPDAKKLSLEAFGELDKLMEYIVEIEADRVFSKSRVGHIQGTRWRGGEGAQGELAVEQVRLIREQIHCWTRHGSWVRQDGQGQSQTSYSSGNNNNGVTAGPGPRPWAARRHRGDARFGQCDAKLMESLDKDARKAAEGGGDSILKGDFYLGDYDQMYDRHIVREAVKWKWVPDESICGPVRTGGQGQGEGEGGEGEGGPSPSSPSTTQGFGDERSIYQSFDMDKFCESLQDRNILVVGDLTQYQLHDVILSATNTEFNCHGEMGCLHRRPHPLCNQNQDQEIEISDVGEADGELIKAPYLKFVRNDIISVPWAVDPDLNEFPHGSTIEQPWATPEMITEYKILLLNRGLFWRNDDEFLMELVFTIKYIWKFYSKTMIIYRATHPVFNCTVLKEQNEDGALAGPDGGDSIFEGTLLQRPLTTAPGRRQAYGFSSSSESTVTQTTEFRPTLADVQRQNRMAKAIVEAAGGIYLDTEGMFAKRPDGRMGDGDCARFCAPGPLDAYADLLYNTFRILV